MKWQHNISVCRGKNEASMVVENQIRRMIEGLNEFDPAILVFCSVVYY